jgi:outer membrane biosynthesis protein TonB
MIVTRVNRNGLVISVLCHLGILAVFLLLARAGSHEDAVVPPDAMQVEFVTPKDIPRYSGTPSMLRTSGSEHAAQSPAPTGQSEQPPTAPQPPRPKDQRQAQRAAPPKPQQSQERQEPHEPQAEAPQAEPPQAKEPPRAKAPPLLSAATAQVAMAEAAPDPPAPNSPAQNSPASSPPAPSPAASAEQTSDGSDTAATAAYLALAGGRLGGGFAAPPIDSPFVGYDFTVPFREVVSTCGALPPGVGPSDKISILVRVFLNRDGTLAAPPQQLDSNPSADQQALMQTFASGLQKCQPYTMLPPDRYSQWKTLDLVVHPHNYLAR